jgi:hypothetical protein
MEKVFQDLIPVSGAVFIDDIAVKSKSFDENEVFIETEAYFEVARL